MHRALDRFPLGIGRERPLECRARMHRSPLLVAEQEPLPARVQHGSQDRPVCGQAEVGADPGAEGGTDEPKKRPRSRVEGSVDVLVTKHGEIGVTWRLVDRSHHADGVIAVPDVHEVVVVLAGVELVVAVNLDQAGHGQIAFDTQRAGDVEAVEILEIGLRAARVQALAVDRSVAGSREHEHDLVRVEEQPRVMVNGVPPGVDVGEIEGRVEDFDQTGQLVEFGGGEGNAPAHIGR